MSPKTASRQVRQWRSNDALSTAASYDDAQVAQEKRERGCRHERDEDGDPMFCRKCEAVMP